MREGQKWMPVTCLRTPYTTPLTRSMRTAYPHSIIENRIGSEEEDGRGLGDLSPRSVNNDVHYSLGSARMNKRRTNLESQNEVMYTKKGEVKNKKKKKNGKRRRGAAVSAGDRSSRRSAEMSSSIAATARLFLNFLFIIFNIGAARDRSLLRLQYIHSTLTRLSLSLSLALYVYAIISLLLAWLSTAFLRV